MVAEPGAPPSAVDSARVCSLAADSQSDGKEGDCLAQSAAKSSTSRRRVNSGMLSPLCSAGSNREVDLEGEGGHQMSGAYNWGWVGCSGGSDRGCSSAPSAKW